MIQFNSLPKDKPSQNTIKNGRYTATVFKCEMRNGKDTGTEYLNVSFLCDGDGFVNVMDDIAIINSITDADPIDSITDYARFAAADLEEDDFINVVDEIKMLNFITDSIDSLNN